MTLKRIEEAALVRRLANIVASSLNLNEVLSSFAAELRKVVEADRISVNIIEDDELRILNLWSKIPSPWQPEQQIPARGTRAAWVVEHGKPLIEADITNRTRFWTNDQWVKAGIRSVIFIPLTADGKVFATLTVSSCRPDTYGKREARLLGLIASQIALPIRNSLAARSLQKANLLNQVILETLQIASSGSLPANEGVLVKGVGCLRKLVSFDSARFLFVDDARENVDIWAVDFPLRKRVAMRRTQAFLGTGTERVLLKGESVIETDISKDRQFSIDDILEEEGYRSVLRVPLFFSGVPFAMFVLLSRQPGAFGKEEQGVVEKLLSVLSHVIWYQRLAAKEQETRVKLQKESEAREKFIAMTAHELRTPLTVMLGSAHLLQGSVQSGAPGVGNMARILQNLVNGAKTMEAKLQDLVDLAKLGSGAFRIEIAPVDVSELIEDMAAYFQSVAGERKQTLTVRMPRVLPLVKADHRRLRQVLMTLLRNALEFTPDGGQMELRARALKANLVIEVQDSGPGMSAEDQRRVFQTPEGVQPDQQPFPGIGLGLRLCKELMEAQKGKIWVKNGTRRGNVFAISLPLYRMANG